MKLLLVLFLVHQSYGIIYRLNATEYAKMPELYHMDDYDTCLLEPGGTYCLTESDLYSLDDSDLMKTIQGYSEFTLKHFNHTKSHRAVCVRKTCKDYIGNRSLDNEEDLKAILEPCLNQSMWDGYKLNTRLTTILYCRRHGEKRPLQTGDFIVLAVLLILVILNGLGTAYDIVRGEGPGNPILMAFSIRRNWKKLIAPAGVGPEPRLCRLKLLNGLRTITMFCVIFSHTALVLTFTYLKNPEFVENSYDDPTKQLIYNGSLVTYTFFVMSGFLLAFNFELHAEKHKVNIWEWPKGLLMRWMRLTPTYALIMFIIMTVMRYLGNGPLWEQMVISESKACDQYWWAHLLYINNYVYDDAHCLPQTWYLAADTQLFGLGLLMCILVRRPKSQMIVLGIMLVVSLVIPAAHTYFENLGAIVSQSPETYRSVYKTDNTFRKVFVRGHTNLSTYTLGIAGGLLAYHWMKNEKSVSERLQKYPWVIWLTFPVGVGIILSGGFFYMDGPEPSLLSRVLYAALHKPIFQLNIVIQIIGCIFKVENVYRGILEWRGFAWMGRVSYSAFLLHSLFQRGLVGSQRLPSYFSEYYVLMILLGSIFVSFGMGAILWLTVESPVAGITKALLAPPRRKPKETDDAVTKI